MQFQPFARVPISQLRDGTGHKHCFAVDGRLADIESDSYGADI